VRVLQRIQHRAGQGHQALERQWAFLAEQVGQGPAFHERHGVVDQALAFAHEVNGQDVGVIEPGRRLGLVPETLQHARRPGDVRPQDFDREPAFQLAIEDLVHLGEPAPAKQAPHLVLGAQRPRQPGSGIGAGRVAHAAAISMAGV